MYNDFYTMILIQWFVNNDPHTTISIQRFLYNDYSWRDTMIFRFYTTIWSCCMKKVDIVRGPQKSLLAGSLNAKSLAGESLLPMIFRLYNDF